MEFKLLLELYLRIVHSSFPDVLFLRMTRIEDYPITKHKHIKINFFPLEILFEAKIFTSWRPRCA